MQVSWHWCNLLQNASVFHLVTQKKDVIYVCLQCTLASLRHFFCQLFIFCKICCSPTCVPLQDRSCEILQAWPPSHISQTVLPLYSASYSVTLNKALLFGFSLAYFPLQTYSFYLSGSVFFYVFFELLFLYFTLPSAAHALFSRLPNLNVWKHCQNVSDSLSLRILLLWFLVFRK